MVKKIVLIIIIALLAMPAHAQDDDELVAYVEDAFLNLYSEGTYTIKGTQLMSIMVPVDDLTAEDVSLDYDVTFEWTQGIDEVGDVREVSGFIEVSMLMDSGLQDMDFTLYNEAIFIDRAYYGYMTMEMEGSDEPILGALDSQWFRIDLNALSDETREELGLDEVSFDTIQRNMGNEFSSRYFLPVSEDTVGSIVELDSVVEDGITYRVFEIEIDNAALVLEGFNDIFSQMATMQGQSPQEIEAAQELMESLIEGITSTQVVYVDVETQLPQRVSLNIVVDYSFLANATDEAAELANMVMVMETESTFNDIGAPFNADPPKDFLDLPPEILFEQ